MQPILLVVRGFGAQKPGMLVIDIDEVDRVLSSEHADHVVRIVLPELKQVEVKGI